jgi:hypothetical protein
MATAQMSQKTSLSTVNDDGAEVTVKTVDRGARRRAAAPARLARQAR